MVFTVDEMSALKPIIGRAKRLEKEYETYSSVVSAFRVWFFILTTIRSLVVSTVIVSMFNQEPDLMVTWNKGEGIGFFLMYLLALCLPVIGSLVNIGVPIAVIVAAFSTGGGIASNFVPYVLPIVIVYVVTFGLILISNLIIDSIIKSSCPNIYEEISFLSGADEFTRMFHESSLQVENDMQEVEDNEIEEAEIVDDKTGDNGYYDDGL